MSRDINILRDHLLGQPKFVTWVGRPIAFVVTLMVTVLVLTACIIEPSARVNVDNQMAIPVTIVHEGISEHGAHYSPVTLGTVPVGQTVTLPVVLILRRDIIGRTIVLRAQDSSGNVVWKKAWPFEEFVKLEQVGWKILVSPETSEPFN